MPSTRLFCSALLAALILSGPLIHAHDASLEMAQAASNFLATLSEEQKSAAVMDFGGAERRNWHFIPRERKGLPFKAMTQEQRLLAQALLATGLSHEGYSKAVSIMSLEAVLADLEKTRVGGPTRDPELYYFTIFGKPGGSQPWGWRLEGHHLSLNFTADGPTAPSMTPAFFGTNPGEVRTGARTGTRILAREEELGRALVGALTPEQRAVAILQIDTPKEILNDPKRVDPTRPEGIPQSQLTPAQTALLSDLIQEYLGRHRPDIAALEWAKIQKAGLERIQFAWAGGLERGQPHYYRVQGQTFVLEYDNTQNEANHVHSLWRDFEHDFGQDLLRDHVQKAHQ